MFVDLVGSTELSARMDPEDLREVISAYQKCVGETVTRLGGFVAKYMGDGVLIYFGYPTAHEDDAERAVRAGLKSVNEVAALRLPVSLQARVGIATGLVVVGDLIGSGGAQEHSVVGETPNLAARLQLLAEPGRGCYRSGYAKPCRRPVRTSRPRVGEPQGHRWARVGVGCAASQHDRKPLRSIACQWADCANRPRSRTPNVAAALVPGEIVPGTSGPSVRRSGDWQIEAYCCTDGAPNGRTPNAVALFLFAAAYR